MICMTLLLLLLTPTRSIAQQDPGFTQYMYNTMLINPAYTGSRDALNLLFMNRNQWVGFEGAPTTQSFALHSPVFRNYVGLGLSYSRDQIGPMNNEAGAAYYAFRFRVHRTGFLALGLKTGFESWFFDHNALNPLNPDNTTYPSGQDRRTFISFGTGIFYHTQSFYLGLSSPDFHNLLLDEDSGSLGEQHQKTEHYYLTSGYVTNAGPSWMIKPSFLVRYVPDTPVSADVNLNVMYAGTIVTGVSHRLGDSFGFMLHLRPFSQFWVGYAYDFGISGLAQHNRGTHEVMIYFDLNRRKPETIISPRFF